ncbi:MAG: S-adenosyl-L-methionine-dependent methyltransferase [Benniella sp.]|nr:MAG: S-adenosyl-L-methionine-dependent methyltransferase [Benniella sp.]
MPPPPPPPPPPAFVGHDTALPEPVSFLTDKDVLASKPFDTTLPAHCYGRVQDPESHVPQAWWKGVFGDNLYLQTDGDVVEDPTITQEEIKLLEGHQVIRTTFQTAPPPGAEKTRILDLCCGQGRHALRLAELYPHLELHGHDQSEYLIDLARSRASEAMVTDRVQFTMGDSREIPHPDNSFSFVMMMGNSFGYFATESANMAVLKEIHRVLRPGGHAILDLTDGAYVRENYAARSWEWVNDAMLVCRERELSKDRKRLICREVVMSTSKGVIRDQFYAESLYSLEEIHQLVREAGLVPLQLKEDGTEEQTVGKDLSKRGEDLGMMEQRLFILFTKVCN